MSSPLITLPNPFWGVIVNDPWQFLETDVSSIHKTAFYRCCAAIDFVRTQHRTTALLIYGEAGSGKTHLLARLRAHLAVEAEADGPGGLQEAVMVPLRMQTSAPIIWRFLRREFARALLRQAGGGQTQLERLLLHHLTEWLRLPVEDDQWLERQRQTAAGMDSLKQHLTSLLDHLDNSGLLDHNLRTVLACLLLHRQRSEAGAWLRGESLPKEVLDKLGVGDEAEDDPEDLAHRVVLGLSSLATAELPIIFSFDQVEALQTHPQDLTGLFAFGQLVRALHDETRHCLLLSCIQTVFLDKLKETVRGANWAGMTAFGDAILNKLNWEESGQLVQARLDALPGLKKLRVEQANPFWPLAEQDVRNTFTEARVSARKLLTHCADLFEARRTNETIFLPPRPPHPQFLQQTWEQRKEQSLSQTTTKESETVLKDGLPRLLHLAQTGVQHLEGQQTRDVELVFAQQGQRFGVSVCNSANGTSLAAKLNRLGSQQQQFDKLLILRDQRLPIRETWNQTKAYRKNLLQRGALWVEPSPESLAALNTLRGLLADAQAGDLANGGETITVETLRDWLLNSLTAELHGIVQEILPVAPPNNPSLELRERIAELLQRHHVMPLADTADLLEEEQAAISACVLNYPDRFGVLGTPPIALFELVNEISL
jgi:hypothetical protein